MLEQFKAKIASTVQEIISLEIQNMKPHFLDEADDIFNYLESQCDLKARE